VELCESRQRFKIADRVHYMKPNLLRLLVMALVFACACGSKDPPSNWIATVASFTGTVKVTTQGSTDAKSVKKGQYLKVGDRLLTGAKSRATLALRNKGRLEVEPNSVVLFRSSAPDTKLNLLLEQGTVVGGGADVQASELLIGVGKKTISLTGGAKATVAVAGEEAKILVSLGEAKVEGPGGETHTIEADKPLVIPLNKPLEPDAGPSPEPDASTEPAPTTETYYLQRVRGRVMVKPPDAKRFQRVRARRWIELKPGTLIKLARRARALFGPEKDREKGSLLNGPSVMRVREPGGDDQPNAGPLEHVHGDVILTHKGEPGTTGSTLTIDGVTITPKVVHKTVDIQVKRAGGRHVVEVNHGVAILKAKKKTLELEAGQSGTINRGRVAGPRMPPQSPFKIRNFGTVRVFTNDRQLPVTFHWKHKEGTSAALVQVSRFGSMARPLFADVIKRRVLTIPNARRGNLFWRVTPVGPDGTPGEMERGRLVLIRDTSYRVLKDVRAPRNTIHESFGNTTVFYQNRLPRFTFRWNAIEGASKYHLKIFRDPNITKPLVSVTTNRTQKRLKSGKLGEGTYIWYVVGRDAGGQLVRAFKGRKLSVRYDNATPDVQIVYPRNAITVATPTIEAKGVAIPGSKVFINGNEVTLDNTSRFTHPVKLNAGLNFINFRVKAPRRGYSVYLRRVTRK
jgi:hypothetical protein